MSPTIRYTSLFSVLFLVATPAMAYIGPGAGLSLLGALWGLVAAVGAALLFVLLWPLRRMLRRRREAKKAEAIPEQGVQLGAEQRVQQGAKQEAQQNQQKSDTASHDTLAQKSTEHSTTADPNAPTAHDSSMHDDVKKNSDAGSR